jgi:glycosyltransferase involved in cell wall biosynthesis
VLVVSGDVDGLAAALDQFATLSRGRLTEMGAAGRRWVEQDFTATRYRSRLLALYGSLQAMNEKTERRR